MATYSNSAREVEMPNGDVVVLHSAPTGGANTTSNIKKFKYDDNGHVTESEAANATDLNLNSYSTPTTGSTAIGTSDAVQTAIGKLDHQSQIDQSNILSVQNKVGKNLLNPYTPDVTNYDTGRGITYTNNKDGTWYVAGTSTQNDAYIDLYNNQTVLPWGLKAGDTIKVTTNSTKVNVAIIPYTSSGYGSTVAGNASTVGTLTLTSDIKGLLVRFQVGASGTVTNENIIGMVCHEGAWNQNSDIELYGAPNYDLTRLEAEDRASLAEVVDSGAKNLVDIADSTTTGSEFVLDHVGISLSAGSYVFSYTSTQSISGNIQMIIRNGTTVLADHTVTSQSGRIAIPFTINSAANNITLYSVRAGTYSDFMICTKAAFGVSQKFVPFGNDPFYQVPINHNMIYRGRNLGASLTDAQHTALSSGNFTDLYLGDYWTKTVTIPAGTYTGGDGEEVTVPAQTNITLKAVIADFDTFYAGYASNYAGINTHHAAVIVTGFSNVVWNKTNSTAGGYVASLIHKWLVGSALPQIETWFGSAKVLSHQKLLTNAITGDAASGWAWSSQKISLLSENQMYGSKVWGNSKAANGGYEPGEAFKHLNVFNHIDANLLFGNKNIWLRDIASAVWAVYLLSFGNAGSNDASATWIAPAALILLS